MYKFSYICDSNELIVHKCNNKKSILINNYKDEDEYEDNYEVLILLNKNTNKVILYETSLNINFTYLYDAKELNHILIENNWILEKNINKYLI